MSLGSTASFYNQGFVHFLFNKASKISRVGMDSDNLNVKYDAILQSSFCSNQAFAYLLQSNATGKGTKANEDFCYGEETADEFYSAMRRDWLA